MAGACDAGRVRRSHRCSMTTAIMKMVVARMRTNPSRQSRCRLAIDLAFPYPRFLKTGSVWSRYTNLLTGVFIKSMVTSPEKHTVNPMNAP